jgi:hypothetical protein
MALLDDRDTRRPEPPDDWIRRYREESDARFARRMAESEERHRAHLAEMDRAFRHIRWMLYAAIIMLLVINMKLWSSPLPE